ncbi:MAG TPA: 3'-5' exonuclease, partial [Steroidobacteraceae bacterium]|nr:3'-5' exonuclease [Steroidobacteraceae bacterium]
MIARGFILQASYRIESRPSQGLQPVIHVYGRLADGGTFLVRDDRQRPHFYIRAADAERAQRLGALEARVVDRRTFDGAPVLLVTTQTPGDVPAVRDRLHSAGLETFEADVRFAVRYLIERGIKGGCEIEGDAVAGDPAVGQHLSWVFDNPLIRPAQVDVEPRVLSFDIETDPKGERLLAISLYAPGLDEVLIVDGTARAMPEKATRCADERSALQAFCDRVIALDPDVLTGWNTIDFDFAVLER